MELTPNKKLENQLVVFIYHSEDPPQPPLPYVRVGDGAQVTASPGKANPHPGTARNVGTPLGWRREQAQPAED